MKNVSTDPTTTIQALLEQGENAHIEFKSDKEEL